MEYVGLDVSQAMTAVCVIDDSGDVVWRGGCRSTPESIASVLRRRAPHAAGVGLETGPLAVWLWHALRDLGFEVVCLHARAAALALKLQANKTDGNDAHGLAQIIRSGWYRPVSVKTLGSHRLRTLLGARARLIGVQTGIGNQIRGLLKTYGIVLGVGKGKVFEDQVLAHIPEDEEVAPVVISLLEVWRSARDQRQLLDRRLEKHARRNPVCRRLMTAPGVGSITALAFVATVDDPGRFKSSRDLGAYLGLVPRKYQSGEVDRTGGITKCGDQLLRSCLFEAAHVLLHRCPADLHGSDLAEWGRAVARRSGNRKAKVALARKLAVVLHRMWVEESAFVAKPSKVAA